MDRRRGVSRLTHEPARRPRARATDRIGALAQVVCWLFQQAQFGCLPHGFDAPSAAERAERVADVHVNGAHGEVQLGRDLAVRASVGNTADDLQLAWREAGCRGSIGPCGAACREFVLGRGLEWWGCESAGTQPGSTV
jgi:hypothetical protein